MLVRAFNCLSEAGLAMDTARLWGWLLAHRNHHSGVAETHPGLGELGGISEVVAAEAHSPEWDRVVAAGIRGWVSPVLVPGFLTRFPRFLCNDLWMAHALHPILPAT